MPGGGPLDLFVDGPLSRLPDGLPSSPADVFALVRRGFADVNAISGGREDMTDAEFMADWADPLTYRFLCMRDGAPVGYLTVLIGLERVTWVPRGPIVERQNELGLSGPPLYVGTLVVDPAQRGGAILLALLRRTVEELVAWNHAPNQRTAVYFDAIGRTAKLLPGLSERVALTVAPTMSVQQLPVPGLESGRSVFVLTDVT